MSVVRPTVRDFLVRLQFASQVCELRAPLGQVFIDEEPGVCVVSLQGSPGGEGWVASSLGLKPNNHQPGAGRLGLSPDSMAAVQVVVLQGRVELHDRVHDGEHLCSRVLAGSRLHDALNPKIRAAAVLFRVVNSSFQPDDSGLQVIYYCIFGVNCRL